MPYDSYALEPPDYQDAQVQPPRSYGFRGALGGASAIGDEEYPVREPVPQLPYQPYADLKQNNPGLAEVIDTAAQHFRISPVTITQLMGASSGFNAQHRDGDRVGYMGVTRQQARDDDPEG